jgi:GNAT superfamily N-acetyltransferase
MDTRLPAVELLQPRDLPDVRDLLMTHGGLDAAQRRTSYGDDFFTVAAPVWLLGARDGADRLVGVVGVRRQSRGAMGFALTVDPDWRSTGLSMALVAAAIGQANQTGAEFLHAQAGPRSIRRLEECGFRPVGSWQRLLRR